MYPIVYPLSPVITLVFIVAISLLGVDPESVNNLFYLYLLTFNLPMKILKKNIGIVNKLKLKFSSYEQLRKIDCI
jgi:hypothetical protein